MPGNPHLAIAVRSKTSAQNGSRRDAPYVGGGPILQNVLSASALRSGFFPPYVLGNVLTYFNVTGYVYDVQQPDPSGITSALQLAQVSAFVDFFPGDSNGPFPTGYALVVPSLDHGDGTKGDTFLPLAPITGRLLNGSLRTIAVGDPVGVLLLSNSPLIGLPRLRYHVRFRNVTYGGATQALTNFAFDAPIDTTPYNLTGISSLRYPYLGP